MPDDITNADLLEDLEQTANQVNRAMDFAKHWANNAVQMETRKAAGDQWLDIGQAVYNQKTELQTAVTDAAKSFNNSFSTVIAALEKKVENER